MESISYDLAGNYSVLGDTYDNKPFFRKHIDMDCESDYIEYMVSILVMRNPHPNIVTIYNITPNYIDMELLSIGSIKKKMNFVDISNAIEHLHSLNIVYIDLKLENIGISFENNKTKIFDFNCCGILLNKNNWIFEPVNSKNYNILKNFKIKFFKDYDYIILDIFMNRYKKKTCWQSIKNIFLIN
jgi:serine/threonine protein kinase